MLDEFLLERLHRIFKKTIGFFKEGRLPRAGDTNLALDKTHFEETIDDDMKEGDCQLLKKMGADLEMALTTGSFVEYQDEVFCSFVCSILLSVSEVFVSRFRLRQGIHMETGAVKTRQRALGNIEVYLHAVSAAQRFHHRG